MEQFALAAMVDRKIVAISGLASGQHWIMHRIETLRRKPSNEE